VLDVLDTNKYHMLSKEQKRNFFLILILVVILLFPPLLFGYYKIAVTRPSQTDKEITFEIKEGETTSQIADRLYELGAINSKVLFNFYVAINRFDKNIQAGVYVIKAGTSIPELGVLLQHGTNDIRVTFLEGWRIEEFARVASAKFDDIDYEEFLRGAKDYEGYLFPDTYFFKAKVTATEVINKLKETFDLKTKDILTVEALKKAGLTKEEAVIFASIVEREAKNKDDRPIVAGILIKRWKEDMKLEADATTQYAVITGKLGCNTESTQRICPIDDVAANIEWWPKDLTAEDLNYDSPYNTRKNVGLPPKPISSVSLSALEAVINSKPTDYYFYVTGKDGNMYYAKTLREHEANIAKYLK
jgi:UPF0755 protein